MSTEIATKDDLDEIERKRIERESAEAERARDKEERDAEKEQLNLRISDIHDILKEHAARGDASEATIADLKAEIAELKRDIEDINAEAAAAAAPPDGEDEHHDDDAPITIEPPAIAVDSAADALDDIAEVPNRSGFFRIS